MFSGYCADCGLVFVSGQKRAPKGCPRCRGQVETVEARTLDDLAVAWRNFTDEWGMASEEATNLMDQIPDAVARYKRRRAKKGASGSQRHRMNKNKRIRQEWKQAHIDLAKEKKRLSGTPKKKTLFDE